MVGAVCKAAVKATQEFRAHGYDPAMPYIEVSGTRLHYLESGEGAVALFIHGFPFDSSMWTGQLAALADRRRCLAFDLRGFGESAPSLATELSMEGHASDLAEAVDGLDVGPVDVIGLSMGGYVALAMWEVFPHLVRSLALVDTRAAADSAEGKAGRDAAAAALVADGRPAWGAGLIDALVADDATTWVRARMREMIEAAPYPALVAALAGMRQRPDRTELLATISVPTLVVVGEADRLTPPAEAEAMAAAIPGATLAVIPGAGHMSPLERPGEVNAALREFLE